MLLILLIGTLFFNSSDFLKESEDFQRQGYYNTSFLKFVHGMYQHLDTESENYNLPILAFFSLGNVCQYMHRHTVLNGISVVMDLFW